jgi:HD domain
VGALPAGRISVNRPEKCRGAPGGVVAESCKVILTARPRADADLIERACTVAARCHQGQTRYSGDPYITHPVAVASILARLHDVDVVDDPTLCAAILHDTVEDTPYTLAALKRDFGTEIALMVTQIMALDRLGRQREREVTQVMAMIRSADTRVVAVKAADRLHNMQTLQFLPQAKQMRKAREALDTFVPVTRQLRLHTFSSELQTLAFAALIRNQPLRLARHRVIVALDIERSTSRPDPVKAELRTMLYELFDAALRTSGVGARRRDRFADRGDGLLALIDPADQELVLNAVIPVFSQLLTSYNADLSDPGDRDRHLRVRIVVHTGNIHDDDNGCFGEALDTAFRLLDTPRAKMALKAARGALVAVISADVWESAAPNGFAGTIRAASRQPVTTQVGGHEYQGWILLPSQAA